MNVYNNILLFLQYVSVFVIRVVGGEFNYYLHKIKLQIFILIDIMVTQYTIGIYTLIIDIGN